MLTKQVREMERQADVLDDMQVVWRGKNPYWFEILDAFSAQGIRYSADRQKYVIKVAAKDYTQAYGILMELNNELEAGW